MYSWQFNSISAIYFLAVCLSILVGIIARVKSNERTAKIFSYMAFSTSLWAIGYFLGVFNKSLEFKFIMLRIEYLGSLSAGYFWFIFVMVYTRHEKWLKLWVKIVLAIIPFLSFVQVLFINSHLFFYKSTSLGLANDFTVFQKVYGPGFYIASSYNYLLSLAGIIFILLDIRKISNIFKKQNIIIITAVLIMLTPNFLYISGNNPIKPYDPTPLAFTLSYLFFLLAIFNFQFLNIIPIAQSLVYRNLKNGVIVLDTKARVVGMNSAAEKILNHNFRQVFGIHVIDLFPQKDKIILDCLKHDEIEIEISFGDKESFFELHSNILKDDSNNLIGRIFMLYDISKQKKAYQELDAFARTVAHDLMSPAASIANMSELLMLGEINEIEHNTFIKHINTSANKMTGIIEALLVLSKISDMKELPIIKLDSEKILDSAIYRLSDLIDLSKAKIIKPEKWNEALGNPEWVEEIWVNYISNAIKYGGISPIVTLSSELNGNMVRMCVSDNGNGISIEGQALLFNEFTRLDDHKDSIIGHGLGLSIVKRIANKLGGEVGVDSQVGKGSTFYFTLPKA